MSHIEELQKIADEWVDRFTAHDLDGCVETFMPGASIYSPYAPAGEGLDAVRDIQESWLQGGETNKKL